MTYALCFILVRQREQYNTFCHFMLTQLDWVCYRWVFQEVLYIVRLSPYLNLILPVNQCLNFEIPLGLGSLLNVAGTVVIQATHGSH